MDKKVSQKVTFLFLWVMLNNCNYESYNGKLFTFSRIYCLQMRTKTKWDNSQNLAKYDSLKLENTAITDK